MTKPASVTVARRRAIYKIVYKQVIGALKADLDGGESIMKEAWEACDNSAELAVAEAALRKIIALIKRGA